MLHKIVCRECERVIMSCDCDEPHLPVQFVDGCDWCELPKGDGDAD